jgi:GNAT superfamily N-acetyltransferase
MRFRPLLPEDAPAVLEVMIAAFTDLARRFHEPPPPPVHAAPGLLRIRHLAGTDPGGAWLAEESGQVVGAALALVREGLWGLSLLVVHPDAQSQGVGRALLARALDHGADASGRVILASADSRALRAYARAGLTLHPSATAEGVPLGVAMPADVRPMEPGDRPMTDAVARLVRGASHGGDLDALQAGGAEVLVVPGGGYTAHNAGELKVLAAESEEAARTLLRAVLARTTNGTRARVSWLTAAQHWAVDVVLEAGLDLKLDGAVFLGGDTGRFSPYLPSGAYL